MYERGTPRFQSAGVEIREVKIHKPALYGFASFDPIGLLFRSGCSLGLLWMILYHIGINITAEIQSKPVSGRFL